MDFLTISRQTFLDDWELLSHQVKDLEKRIDKKNLTYVKRLKLTLDKLFIDIVKEVNDGKVSISVQVDSSSDTPQKDYISGSQGNKGYL